MAPASFKQFIKRVTIHPRIPFSKIYHAWATQEGLESWFLKTAIYFDTNGTQRKPGEFALPGDNYKWGWYGYEESVSEQRKVLSANGENFFQFEFSGGCIVSVSVKTEDGEHICELKQDMTMDNEKEQQFFFIECGKGWTFYMANLKSILEGGIDLRNRNVNIQSVINA